MTDSALGVPVVFEPTSEAKAKRVATLRGLALVTAVTPNAGELHSMASQFRASLQSEAPVSKILSRPRFAESEDSYMSRQKQLWAVFKERQLNRLASGEHLDFPFRPT